MTCTGSTRRISVSPAHMFHTAGAVRVNEARNVRCPVCGREFAKTRITHTDHGIPTPPQAMVPRHNKENR